MEMASGEEELDVDGGGRSMARTMEKGGGACQYGSPTECCLIIPPVAVPAMTWAGVRWLSWV